MNNRSSLATLTLAALLTIGTQVSADPAAQQQIERLQRQVDALQTRLQALEQRFDAGVPLNKALQVEPQPGGWRNAANWALLAVGMTQAEVVRILGEPDNQRTIKKFEHWDYGDGKTRLYLNRLKSWEIPSQARNLDLFTLCETRHGDPGRRCVMHAVQTSSQTAGNHAASADARKRRRHERDNHG